jgi:hypothetical protein
LFWLSLLLGLPVGVAGDLQGVLIGHFDIDVLLVEALDVAIDLPALLGLVDSELGAQGSLALLTLPVSLALRLKMRLALGLAVDLAQQLINLAEEMVE